VTKRSLPARRWACRAPLLAALLAGPALVAADAPPGADEWKFDVVYRKKGPPLRGLVLAQGPAGVDIKCISRKPGSPTIVFLEKLSPAEVERVELLPPEQRQLLGQRLDALKQERKLLGERLKALNRAAKGPVRSGDHFDLRPAEDRDLPGKALRYESGHFRLVSNARAEVVQLAAIQLEQVYAAYARCLPPRPRTPPGKPTKILLAGSLQDYEALVRRRRVNLINPAFYDPARNEIVCGSDLERLSEGIEKARCHHDKLNAEIGERLKELGRAYKGFVPAELKKPLDEARAKILAAERLNHAAFARARDRLFQTLYHEAFHAYLANYVYPGRKGQVPNWLNEGLAQIFETAIVEVGELRVGHADEKRLVAVRTSLAARTADPSWGTLLPPAELLRSRPQDFLVAHAQDRQVSDRYYLAAWALTFHLTFGRKVLGTKAFNDYVAALDRGTDPVAAFEGLAGRPLPKFEQEYLQYLKQLKPDGTAGPAPPP
jgi:hypothetical protein